MKQTESTHLTCPACGTVVRPTQVIVRRHRGAILCYALTPLVGFAAGWIALELGLFGGTFHRGKGLLVSLPMIPLLVLARRLPRVRVVHCPTCCTDQRACLGRTRHRRRP